MALLQSAATLSHRSICCSTTSSPITHSSSSSLTASASNWAPSNNKYRNKNAAQLVGFVRRNKSFAVSSSLDTAATVGQVTEVDKDTFWPIVNAAGDKTVVLDMYTQWCGPCKIIAPKYQELSQKYDDVIFLKLDCNQENKPLAKELGIRVVPTFKILKHDKVVKEITGAKFDDLVAAIETVRTS
ncbi:thioredoxin F-type, chloroplastic-like isoform X2 [Argentina anserina]|uniref:thioredoxin F-type, chloroplastic-like isoform X2 n=1 Tax=Argentina anserina TaxID=57926 RepID=UPI0021762815|nr:thioredoxin F-type, chloroplastic-like isoform X2 [Potentilla anserina]